MEKTIGKYRVSDDKTLLQTDEIQKLLKQTYWANTRTAEVIEKSVEASICFGAYLENELVGFARCVTDYSTIYWLSDVVVDETHRGNGLGKALVEAVVNHEDLKDLRGILITSNAQGLYEKYGFIVPETTFMRRTPDTFL